MTELAIVLTIILVVYLASTWIGERRYWKAMASIDQQLPQEIMELTKQHEKLDEILEKLTDLKRELEEMKRKQSPVR